MRLVYSLSKYGRRGPFPSAIWTRFRIAHDVAVHETAVTGDGHDNAGNTFCVYVALHDRNNAIEPIIVEALAVRIAAWKPFAGTCNAGGKYCDD